MLMSENPTPQRPGSSTVTRSSRTNGCRWGSRCSICTDEISSYIYAYRLESYFGQFLYDYDGKYLLSTALRRDGSSRYLNNKWGTFASIGLGWVVSKENFLKEKEWLPYLKLKASYGTIGTISAFAFFIAHLLIDRRWGLLAGKKPQG